MENVTGFPDHERADIGEREDLTETRNAQVSQRDFPQEKGIGLHEEVIRLQSPDEDVSYGSSDNVDAGGQSGFADQDSADLPNRRASVPEKTKDEYPDSHNAKTVQLCDPRTPENHNQCMNFDGQLIGGDRSSQPAVPDVTQHGSTHMGTLGPANTCPSVDDQRNGSSPGIDHDVLLAPHAPNNSQSGHAGPRPMHHPFEVSPTVGKRAEVADTYTPNIVIFGETGVGKSSVINLIAGQELARTSADALGCTFHHEPYSLKLGETPCVLWDTTGLDEGSEGTVPAKQAENNLKELMQKLACSGGINLVIYCIRGSRLTRALKRNYDLFYVTVCRKKVHVALVVTCLEHQEGGMDTWWARNMPELRRHGMRFDAHVCVTTLNVENDIIQQRRTESQALLRKLLVDYSGRAGWRVGSTFISRVLPSFHRVMSPTGSFGGSTIIRKVTACGSFVGSFPGATAELEKSTGQICGGWYQMIRIDKCALSWVTPRMLEEAGGVGSGVLVFYASLEGNRIRLDDIEALKTFYDVAGGEFHPLIVVLQGSEDERVARACEAEVATRHADVQADYIPIPVAADKQTRSKLEEMIERKCVERLEPRFRFFRRYLPRQFLLALLPEASF